MKKLILPLFLAVASVASFAPLAQAQTPCPAAPAPITVSGSITSNTTWTSDNIYLLNGFVYVDNNATLTIQPGTIIKGDKASLASLIVRQGGKLIAEGTAAQPIVFTSNQPVGSRNRGDWGGIVICGRAPINQPGTPNVEGVTNAVFGGTDANDNSGILRYVRIEYPGILISQNNEINGLTMAGVGAGTTIDYVQVYGSGDDSFEWFGGTVNAKHLVAVGATDDDFDTDFGYSGKVQYAVTIRDGAQADVSGSTALESDNDANGSSLMPLTSPVFSNVSAFLQNPSASANFTRAIHLRRNTQLSLFNSVLTGWPIGLTLEGAGVQGSAGSGAIAMKNNVLAGITNNFQAAGTGTTTYDVAGFWNTAANSNNTYTATSALNLNSDNFNAVNANGTPNGTPSFVLPSNSPLVSGAAFADPKLAGGFFENVAFRGAFGTTNWAAGWTNFSPNTTCYNRPGLTLSNKKADEQVQGLSVAPNPTEGASKLVFELKRASAVTVRVLDVTGRTVAVVRDGQKLSTGVQNVELPASLQAGLYVASVTTGESTQAVRFVVTK